MAPLHAPSGELALIVASASVGPSAYWYLTRSTGAVSLILLTVSVVLGVVDVSRWSSERWPRFVLDALHRNVSMLVLAFVGLHVLTAVLDSFAPIGLLEAVVPFVGSYRPLWLGLGAVAFDLLLAVAITSALRRRLGHRAWRAVHWCAYACWPIALVHTLGTGSDVKGGWLLTVSAACLVAVVAAAVVRARTGWPERVALRRGALVAVACVPIGLIVWLPVGPLGADWARRAGTPAALLGTSALRSSRLAASHRSASPGPQAGVLQGPFEAALAGTLEQGPGHAAGLVAVRITTTFNGAPRGQLDIEIDGTPLAGGGVALRSSRVTLGTTAAPTMYTGAITALSGTRLAARVQRGDGHALTLDVALQIGQGGQVTGQLAASPSANAPGR